ncbi:MAG: xanthine dehydrogenase family protein molybdopterin-binding subunit, partial [Alphaproteobacteria bacterium]|nr:xanthine dehydrogenase family protein molybdopterin-binding subunit [Alphaproteobacteria bacterium]
RADDLPQIAFSTHSVPCTTNPLGVKGAGEAGAIGAPPAVVNAVLDALKPFGVHSIDMPVTAEKVWRLLHTASGSGSAPRLAAE